MANSTGIVLITGPPGVGKTTLVRKICANLSGVRKLQGFYTEEVRDESHQRIGFDVVTLAGQRGILARVQDPSENYLPCPKVGKYSVYCLDFDKVILPILNDNKEPSSSLWVIDEVGKMELCSFPFEDALEELIYCQVPLLATIPQQGQSLPMVKLLKQQPGAVIYHVTESNRDALCATITEYLTK
ncbi:uncharacterized protein Dwil_GK13424 [Drosophila willistoni]|uniref:AAA+ ATPase domain-containing protein n=1 Tax=Drosophila willistoni TaxID=7260 RepID=B4N3V1_DROWI|nr:nucleoside-triphosphatase THEP1 [Drosophila willistoni]EDW79306.1 uncharacterized protein Dwil_GK13424 [Drosophila willistoni]